MTEYERIREKIIEIIKDAAYTDVAEIHYADEILSLDGIEIRADDQSLPDYPSRYITGEAEAMLKPDPEGRHWVRVIPKPKKEG